MIYKYFIALLFALGLYSCSDVPRGELRHDKYFGSYTRIYTPVSIDNGPRKGWHYYDSSGLMHNYLCFTTTITNDTLVPVHLSISFSEEYNYLRYNNLLNSRVFLLPHGLTGERQAYSDNSMSKELKEFLKKGTAMMTTLDTILKPGESVVVTFGMLNLRNNEELRYMQLIATNSQFQLIANDSPGRMADSSAHSASVYLALDIINSLIIPCGKISFLKSPPAV